MNAEQLLKQVYINRDLILRQNENAREHLDMLLNNYVHLVSGEVEITVEMNKALVKLYFDTDYVGAIDISLKTIDAFKHSAYKTQLAFHKKMVAHCNLHLGEYDIAIQYLQEAIDTLPVDDEKYAANKADMLFTMAQAEEFKDIRSEKMAAHLHEALNLLCNDVETVRKANCLVGLGNYYNNINEPAEALKYFHEAATTFENKYLIHHIANTYSNMGICYLQLKDCDKAEYYMQKALDLRMKAASPDMLAVSYTNFGRLFIAKKEYAKAREFLTLSQKIATEIGYKHLIDKNEELLNAIAADTDKPAGSEIAF